MADATVRPTWAVWVVSVGAPVGAVIGVLVSNWLASRVAKETEKRSNREETMRILRWAAELAISDNPGSARLGQGELVALGDSAMKDKEQQTFIDAALEAVVAPAAAAIDDAEKLGEEVVVEVEGSAMGATSYEGHADGSSPAV